jgi:hypothetical protein
MSRPPYPGRGSSDPAPVPADAGELDYLPAEYEDLLALARQRAASSLGRAGPEIDVDDGGADLTATFLELSSLVGHVLSVYQRHLAREAFLSTARTRGSLLRHARRLCYEPDPGVAATGHVVLITKPGVSGTVAARLPLASVPIGDVGSQDYETRDGVVVAADLNRLVPLESRRAVTVTADVTSIQLAGVDHALAPGNRAVVVAPVGEPATGAGSWTGAAVVVESAVADPAAGVTTVHLRAPLGLALPVDPVNPPVLLAHPRLALRQFAGDADPAQYPPEEVRCATAAKPAPSSPTRKRGQEEDETVEVTPAQYWYQVHRPDQATGEPSYRATDVYLSEQLATPLLDAFVLHQAGSSAEVLRVAAQTVAAVTLHREAQMAYAVHTVDLVGEDGGYKSSIVEKPQILMVASHVAGTVTTLAVTDRDGKSRDRSTFAMPGEWLAGWTVQARFAAEEPDPGALGERFTLPGTHPALTPGRPLVLTDRAATRSQVVTVRLAVPDANAGTTAVEWDEVTPTPQDGWRLDDVVVHGNVVRVSHGRTVEENLGGSDGVTSFQRFELKESPVTVLLGASGGEPQLEVRVDHVRWTRVADFGASNPEDRHYRTVTDEHQTTAVVFGDGRNGAVPPSGRRNVTAVYQVGLGGVGDVEPLRLSRLKRAHPLLDRVVNLTAVSGGAEPADEAAIRTQATRFVRTFDRAVSAADLADLALTIPGVARAASRWDQAAGAVVVVATVEGQAPDLAAVRAFLDARRDTTVPLRLTGPVARSVHLTLTLDTDPAYARENVEDSVRAALHGRSGEQPGLFTFAARQLGQPAFRSELYARLQGLPGVVGLHIDRFHADGGIGVADLLDADVGGWLRLEPHDLAITSRAVSRR